MIIEGIISAMVTPMHQDGSVNEAELRNQIHRHIRAGADGIFCLGTNGEFYILNSQEKIRIMEICVEEAKGRVSLYAGTGCIGTKDTVELSKTAERIGFDAISVITPYFAALDQKQLFGHFAAVAEAVDIPIVLYNMPARTGVNIAPETLSRLAGKYDNIRGIKDSSGNFSNILQYIAQTDPEKFSVLSGNDALILWTLLAGGKGGITAIANILPELMVRIFKYYQAGDLPAAKKAQEAIAPIRACLQYGNPNTIVKRAANLIGQPVGPCREPFAAISQETERAIADVIEKYYGSYKV